MTDFRLPENRREYFTQLYRLNLEHKIMPGLVYLFMPELSARYNWSDEQKLWFAFINGMTQNPITSIRIMEASPFIPQSGEEFKRLDQWFNSEWNRLSFDTDRRKQKRDTLRAVWSYAELVKEHGSQVAVWKPGEAYSTLWARANGQIHSFGRLSAFSYLEYVKVMGFGADCDDLMFEDKSGSKSHRNGMMFLLGHDSFVWDKRLDNGFDGNYDNLPRIAGYLDLKAREYLKEYNERYPHPDANNFTLESQCCQFKNGFFARRYPGVYADMSLDRIKWYDERGMQKHTETFKDIRAQNLPEWLREECEPKPVERKFKASRFKETGIPFRAEHFLKDLM